MSDSTRDLLEQALNGLKWYREAHPKDDSGADDELYARIEAALAEPAVVPAVPSDAEIDKVIAAHGTGGWQTTDDMRRFARAVLALSPKPQAAKCCTCNDEGLIGGPSFYNPDEGGVPCPDCTPRAATPAAPSAADAAYENEHPAAKRMREAFEAKYGHASNLMRAANHWFNVRTEWNEAWNRDREKPVTEDDVAAAESAMLAALAQSAAVAAPACPSVHPSIASTLSSLEAEVDGGWTPDAQTALRKLRTLIRMHGAAPAPAASEVSDDDLNVIANEHGSYEGEDDSWHFSASSLRTMLRRVAGPAAAVREFAETLCPTNADPCKTCGATEPFTGTCGTRNDDTQALCKRILAPAYPIAAPAPASEAVEKWIFDPHDIEQGMMLNPAWLELHGLTAQEALKAAPPQPAGKDGAQ